MERWREGRWGGNVAEEGVCTPAEGPSLQHGAAPPHPGSHAHLDCKRQVMGAPGSPQSRPCGEENQRPGCMCNLGQQPRAEWDPGAGMLHPKGSRCWQGGERREPGAVPVGHYPPRGCKAGGPPPPSRCETQCIAPSPQRQPQESLPAAMPGAQLGHRTHMAPRGSRHPQKSCPPGSRQLLAAGGPRGTGPLSWRTPHPG